MPRYLVTGGCGFIGSHLVDALMADGNVVRVVDDLSTGSVTYLPSSADFVQGDLRDPAVTRATMAGVEGCFHLAAVASVARCNEDWHHSHLANLAATVALFEAAAQRCIPVVYASSAAVYGDHPHLPLREGTFPRPLSPYGIDKAAGELHARAGAKVHSLASVGLRFFNVYGTRQRPGDPYSGVVSTFLERLQHRQPLVLNGDGGQTRDFVFVADVVLALRAAMAALESGRFTGASVFNVCTGRAVSITELAGMAMAATGITVPLEHAPARAGDIRRSLGASDLAERELGFNAAVTIEDGLRRLVGALARQVVAEVDRKACARPGTAY